MHFLTSTMNRESLSSLQMAFIFVVAQELITGKGVIQGVQEGDPINIAFLGATIVSILSVTAVLAIKGDDNYVDKSLGRK
jgi:hypothetical protein